MKACSYCGHENEDTASTCAECGTPIVAAQPDPDAIALSDPLDNLVVVAKCRTSVEAYLLCSRLEGAGIEACVPEEFTPQIFWSMIPSPLEQVTVRVKARDLEQAKRIAAETGAESDPSSG